jgi:hypothetical protein
LLNPNWELPSFVEILSPLRTAPQAAARGKDAVGISEV